MAKNQPQFSKNCTSDSILLYTLERIRLKHQLFRVIAYKLVNGQTAITTRQMAVAVRKPPKTAKEFLKKTGIRSVKVQMPNRVVTDMIPISTVAAFWKYLNESGKGNTLTRVGQKYLDGYISDSLM